MRRVLLVGVQQQPLHVLQVRRGVIFGIGCVVRGVCADSAPAVGDTGRIDGMVRSRPEKAVEHACQGAGRSLAHAVWRTPVDVGRTSGRKSRCRMRRAQHKRSDRRALCIGRSRQTSTEPDAGGAHYGLDCKVGGTRGKLAARGSLTTPVSTPLKGGCPRSSTDDSCNY